MKKQTRKLNITKRDRLKRRLRKKISGTDSKPRICVFKSSKHTYAQLISDESKKTLVSASTLDKEVQSEVGKIKIEKNHSQAKSNKSIVAAKAVGAVLSKRAASQGIKNVVFDRNGYIYAGRVKSVADGAREGGLEF